MQAQIERFLILGDILSKEDVSPRGSTDNTSIWQEVPIDGCYAQTASSWADFFFDMVCYTENRLSSRITQDDNDARSLVALDIYLRLYCASKLQSTPSDTVYSSPGQQPIPSLKTQRELIACNDTMHEISAAKLDKTLVIEWSGTNDLILTDVSLTLAHARKVADARIENVEEMIKMGYKNFVLFNLPDLTKAPYFKGASNEKTATLIRIINSFNQSLYALCGTLKDKYLECSINIYDVNGCFMCLYQKLKLEDIFQGGVNLTEVVFKSLAADFYRKCFQTNYLFLAPLAVLLAQFREAYQKCWLKDKKSMFGWFYDSKIDYSTKNLVEIFKHVNEGKKNRTFNILVDLGWIFANKKLRFNHPKLILAMAGQTSIEDQDIDADLVMVT
jgi:hypothetical protein